MLGLEFLHKHLENLVSACFEKSWLSELKDNNLNSSLSSYLRFSASMSLITCFFPLSFLFNRLLPSCCLADAYVKDEYWEDKRHILSLAVFFSEN